MRKLIDKFFDDDALMSCAVALGVALMFGCCTEAALAQVKPAPSPTTDPLIDNLVAHWQAETTSHNDLLSSAGPLINAYNQYKDALAAEQAKSAALAAYWADYVKGLPVVTVTPVPASAPAPEAKP